MRYVYYVSVRIIYGMCITTVRKNLHPHKKVRQLNLRNIRQFCLSIDPLEKPDTISNTRLINMIAYSMSTGSSARLERQFLGTAP